MTVTAAPATVSRILRRLGLNRLCALEPAEPVRRYERAAFDFPAITCLTMRGWLEVVQT